MQSNLLVVDFQHKESGSVTQLKKKLVSFTNKSSEVKKACRAYSGDNELYSDFCFDLHMVMGLLANPDCKDFIERVCGV